MVDMIVMAGVAALLAWGVSKLLFGFCTRNLPEYIVNFDGSDGNQLGKAGAGCVIRDKKGEFVIAAAYNLDDCSHVAMAEATALRIGLELAKVCGIKLGLIQGHSLDMIRWVQAPELMSWEPRAPLSTSIIQEIRCSLEEQSMDPESQLRLTIWEKNEVAHELALLGRQLHQGRIYRREQYLPTEIANVIQREKLVWDSWLRVIWQD